MAETKDTDTMKEKEAPLEEPSGPDCRIDFQAKGDIQNVMAAAGCSR